MGRRGGSMRENRRLVAASALSLSLAALLGSCGGSDLAEGSVAVPTVSGTAVNENRRADPSTFYSGALNQDALKEALEFDAYPLLWLGEEFEGFYLMNFVRFQDESGFDVVYLVYGECEPAAGMLEPSCVPPLSISTTAPGWVPDPGQISDDVGGPLTTERGVNSRTLGDGPVLWTGGVVVTIFANSELEQEALAQVQTVNHDVMGRPPIGPGENLAPVGE
jgi:hypothetical protein